MSEDFLTSIWQSKWSFYDDEHPIKNRSPFNDKQNIRIAEIAEIKALHLSNIA